ncbi:hypothetical protein FBU59_003808, partial [Linderina macrospora]
MGQQRLRLVNKAAEEHGDANSSNPAASPKRSSRGRPKKARKPDAGNSETPPADDSTGAAGKVKEECLRLFKAVKEMEK